MEQQIRNVEYFKLEFYDTFKMFHKILNYNERKKTLFRK